LWILKHLDYLNAHWNLSRCTPFDPLVDTETSLGLVMLDFLKSVAPPSIRLWILKHKHVLKLNTD